MIFNHVLGLPWQARASVEQDNCCINIIDVDSNETGKATRYLVRAVNLTAWDLNKSTVHLTNMEQIAQNLAAEMAAS